MHYKETKIQNITKYIDVFFSTPIAFCNIMRQKNVMKYLYYPKTFTVGNYIILAVI